MNDVTIHNGDTTIICPYPIYHEMEMDRLRLDRVMNYLNSREEGPPVRGMLEWNRKAIDWAMDDGIL